MNRRFVMAFFLAAVLSVSGADQIQIEASKQLDSKRRSATQDHGPRRTSVTQKDYFYKFDVLPVSKDLANPLKFEWAIMIEDWRGFLRIGTYGSCQTNVAAPKTTVETDAFEINSRDWQGPKRSGKEEERLAGFGLRVTDSNGKIIAEKYDPDSMKKEIDWKKIDKWADRENRQEEKRARNDQPRRR